MKFGICNEIFREWHDLDRTLEYIKEIGYDGVEIAPFTLKQYVNEVPAKQRDQLREKAESIGLEVLGIHWAFVGPEGVHLTHPEKATRDLTADYMTQLVDFCADIGGSVIVFGSPNQRNIEGGVSREQAQDYAREVFSPALERCAERDVILGMEQLTHLETNFCSTVAETVDFIRWMDHPNFKLTLDTKAMTFEPAGRNQLIREHADLLAHFHANDENLSGPGFGDVDFAPIMQALKDVDYQGYVSVEVFNFDAGARKIATKSLEYLKQFV